MTTTTSRMRDRCMQVVGSSPRCRAPMLMRRLMNPDDVGRAWRVSVRYSCDGRPPRVARCPRDERVETASARRFSSLPGPRQARRKRRFLDLGQAIESVEQSAQCAVNTLQRCELRPTAGRGVRELSCR